jgi:hypothetical protein
MVIIESLLMEVVSIVIQHPLNSLDPVVKDEFQFRPLNFTPFRRMMKFQSEPTLVLSHKFLKFLFLVSLENGRSLSVRLHPNLSQTGLEPVGDLT